MCRSLSYKHNQTSVSSVSKQDVSGLAIAVQVVDCSTIGTASRETSNSESIVYVALTTFGCCWSWSEVVDG